MDPASAPVQVGQLLAGKYRVERVLGVGGMGVVVAARHLQLDQAVALKFMLPEALANAEAVERFLREARNAARLRSEHVARIIDVGTLENGSPYIVMEYLSGRDLGAVLAASGPLATGAVADFVLQACDAVAEAHALGIVHRDLKPPNLFLTVSRDGSNLVKVLDFGISKSTAAGDLQMTRTSAIMGSPAYMSPEQMRSAKLVDARTDIWALGVIMYQLVSGQVPFSAETFTELCLKVAMDPLPALPAALPRGFEAMVRRCLEKDPAARYPDVHALAQALVPFAAAGSQALVDRVGRVLRGDGSSGGLPVVPAAVPAASWPASSTLGAASGERVKRRGLTGARGTALIAFVVLAAGAAIGVAVAVGGSPARPAGAAPATAAAPAPAPPAPRPAPDAAVAPAAPAPASVSAPPDQTLDSPPATPPETPPAPASSPGRSHGRSHALPRSKPATSSPPEAAPQKSAPEKPYDPYGRPD